MHNRNNNRFIFAILSLITFSSSALRVPFITSSFAMTSAATLPPPPSAIQPTAATPKSPRTKGVASPPIPSYLETGEDFDRDTLNYIFANMLDALETDDNMKKEMVADFLFNVDGVTCLLPANEQTSDPETVEVIMSMPTFQALLEKKMSPPGAVFRGKLQVKGKKALAMKLNNVMDVMRTKLHK